jgi:hypothetical protein
MNEGGVANGDRQQVVYLSEYGASVPAWVSLDTGRWLRRRGAMGLSLMWVIIWSLFAQHVEAATFTHVNETVQRLELAADGYAGGGVGAVEVLEPTAGHPLYSLTRGDWVKAGELVPGERLQTRSGVAQVLSVTASPGAQRVFNFEVEGEHEYLVGGLEVRSHNSCAPDAPKVEVPGKPAARKPIDSTRPQHGSPEHDATGFNKAKEWQGDPNTKIGADGQPEVRYNQALSDGENQLSKIKPDVQRVRTDGKIDVEEVRSKSQKDRFMDKKIQKIKDILGEKAGEVKWREPENTPNRL